MNSVTLVDKLKSLGACSEAILWARQKSFKRAWVTCSRADWMLWLCAQMEGKPGWPTRQQIVLAACACAETALPIFEKQYPYDSRPRKAIETARKWAQGEATSEEARAAYAAAYAAAGTGYAGYAAYAAADAAADAAAYAAIGAAHVVYVTKENKLAEMAKTIRGMLNVPEELEL